MAETGRRMWPTAEESKEAIERMNADAFDATSKLRRLLNWGYSVQVSTCRDTAWVARFSGLPGWSCAVRGLPKAPNPKLRARCVALELNDAIGEVYQQVIERGGRPDDSE